MNNYNSITVKKAFTIDALVTIYYFEYDKFYTFGGESHDFWEFLFVDKGSIFATADHEVHQLNAGDIIFHAPGEFHDVSADGISNPNLVVVSFHSKDLPYEAFQRLMTKLTTTQRQGLMNLIKTAVHHHQDNHFILKNLVTDDLLGLHTLQCQLELFLLSLLSSEVSYDIHSHLTTHSNQKKIAQLKAYIHEHQSEAITIKDMKGVLNCSEASLYNLIKTTENVSPIHWMNRTKMALAKDLLRDQSLNITQVSERLGYSSIHYFSKVFKALEGMSPKAYLHTIKSKIEAPNQ